MLYTLLYDRVQNSTILTTVENSTFGSALGTSAHVEHSGYHPFCPWVALCADVYSNQKITLHSEWYEVNAMLTVK